MDTYIAYFDETGDDGVTTASSEFFVLTSLYMSTKKWQSNFNKIRECRKSLKEQFGFHISGNCTQSIFCLIKIHTENMAGFLSRSKK